MACEPPVNVKQDSTDYRRLHGHWLVFVRGIWLALVVLTLTIFFASLPMYLAQLDTPCGGTTCWYTRLSSGQVGALNQFPSGQFVPRWMRLSLVVFVAGLVPTAFVAPSMPNPPVDRLTNLVSLGELATLAILQIYRYRRVSSHIQRQ